MKRLLFLLAITLSVSAYGQREVLTTSTSGFGLVDSVNNAHDDLADSIATNFTNISALLDSISDYIAGKPVAAGVKNAGFGQDGYVIGWDNTGNYYALQEAGGNTDSSFVKLTFVPTASITPTEGDVYYDSDVDTLYVYDGANYQALNGAGGGGSGDVSLSDSTTVFVTPTQLSDSISGLGGGHDAVTLAGNDYLTLSTQEITAGDIDLTDDVTGVLPDANVANDITITNVSQIQDLTASAAEINYTDGVTSSIQDQMGAKQDTGDYVNGSDTLQFLTDQQPYFGAVLGVSNAGDTIAFTLNNVVWAQKWSGTHTLHITEVTFEGQGTSPDVDLALLTASTFEDGSPTAVFSADATFSGTELDVTSFNDATITADDWLWLRVDEATTKPTQLVMTITGYLE